MKQRTFYLSVCLAALVFILPVANIAISKEGDKMPAHITRIGTVLSEAVASMRQNSSHLSEIMKIEKKMLDRFGRAGGSLTDNDLKQLDDDTGKVDTQLREVQDSLLADSLKLQGMNDIPAFEGSVLFEDIQILIKGIEESASMIKKSLELAGETRSIIQTISRESSERLTDQVKQNIIVAQEQVETGLSRLNGIESRWGTWIEAADIREIDFFLYQIFSTYFCGGQFVTIMGTNNSEVIEGTKGLDVINGRGGDDEIYGEPIWANQVDGEGDIICGGSGNDHISGKAGDDVIYGGYGDDHIVGNQGSHHLYGGPGNDYILGGYGNDVIYGGSENDRIFGQLGEDYIHGEDGDDMIHGGGDQDYIYGGHGSDLLYGQQGNDHIHGGPSDGNLSASGISYPVLQFSNGQVCGGSDWDYIYGGSGNDTLYGKGGKDYIRGGDGDDYIVGGYCPFGNICMPDEEEINNPDGRDCIYGELGDDWAYGSDGDDYMDGSDGNDKLLGEEGDDFIYGKNGDDVISGQAGNDTLIGDGDPCSGAGTTGNDHIEGGDGDDNLKGGPLTDTCNGGTGNDTTDGSCETETSIP